MKWYKKLFEQAAAESIHKTPESPEHRVYTYKYCSCGSILVLKDGPRGNGEYGLVEDLQEWTREDFIASMPD